jgi:hypothetical protein
MSQGRKVLAASLGYWYESGALVRDVAEWRCVSAELASSLDLSEACVLLGMVRVLGPWGTLRLLWDDTHIHRTSTGLGSRPSWAHGAGIGGAMSGRSHVCNMGCGVCSWHT